MKLENITIRPMSITDLSDVLEIERVSFFTPWSYEMFLGELISKAGLYLVAEVNGELAGYIGAWEILDEIHINNVAVKPKFRGQRIAQKLIEALDKAGIEAFTLEVRISNEPAKKLYERLGFVVEGVRKGYYTDTNEDALIMWKYKGGEHERHLYTGD